jgi:TRAP-type C4-dicarboxylate transport system substrate-binding protein
MVKVLGRWVVLALLCAGVMIRGAQAQSAPITLRIADVYPVGHNVSEGTAKFFMEEVRKRSNGRINFEYYPAEQLGKGKDMLQLTQTGVTDIGLVVPSYISDKMPLSAVAELPGGYATSCQGSMAFWSLTHGGALEKLEFAPNGVRVLIAHTLNPFQFFTTKHVHSLDDLRGQKMRSLGALMDLTIQTMGGVPMHISAPEIHEAMARGTIDGGLMSVETVTSYDLTRMVKSATTDERFGGAVVTYAISEARWKTLPPDVQALLMSVGEAATRNGCERAEGYAAPAFDKLKQANVEFFDFPPDQRKQLDVSLANVANKWAADLEARGKPGREVLQAYTEALRKQGS